MAADKLIAEVVVDESWGIDEEAARAWIECFAAVAYVCKITSNFRGLDADSVWLQLTERPMAQTDFVPMRDTGHTTHTYYCGVYRKGFGLPFLQTPYAPRGNEIDNAPLSAQGLIRHLRKRSRDSSRRIQTARSVLRGLAGEFPAPQMLRSHDLAYTVMGELERRSLVVPLWAIELESESRG